MPRKTVNCQQKPANRRELYTPPPVRSRVIARHVNGQSNRRIAREEGIDSQTVSRILSQREVVDLIAQYQTRLLEMLPKAVGVYDEALSSGDLRIAAGTATKLLEGFKVLPKDGIELPTPESDRQQRKLIFLGQMLETLLYKKQHHGLALPPEFDGLEEEARKRVEGVTP
jgi:hypothetical protein